MKHCVAIMDVGAVPYSKVAREVLTDYFSKNNITFHFITSALLNCNNIDYKNTHPSWWKMIIHRLLPGYDYIICWDLDLLPRLPTTNILQYFNYEMLCLAYDSPGNKVDFSPNFKYNGGLIGIPSKLAYFTEYIYDTYAPGTLPSYEQYYLNEEIANKKIPVHELPRNINVLYPVSIEEKPQFYNALCQHYTYGYGSQENRLKLMENHAKTYFAQSESFLFPTRNDLVKEFINKDTNIAEIGVFKGEFSKFLLIDLEPKHLALFDLFEGYCGSGDVDGNNMQFVYLENEYNRLQSELSVPCVSLHKGDSSQKIKEHYSDEFFNFIYIDAEHTYESVKRDLEICYAKIKDKGFIMGHDYDVNPEKTTKNYDYAGVRQAVQEFCSQHGLKILAKGMDGCISFCIQVLKNI